MAGCRVIWWITDIIQSSDILFPHKTHSQRLESPQKNFTHFYGTSWWAQLPTFWEQKLDQQLLAFDGITENVTCPKQSSWLVDVARLTPKLHLFIDLTLRLDGTTAPLDTPVLLWRCSRSSMTLHGPRKLQTCAGRRCILSSWSVLLWRWSFSPVTFSPAPVLHLFSAAISQASVN